MGVASVDVGQSDLVSVIIPAYNAQGTLDATLTSVRSQSHRNLEIVVVDDGSSDATFSVAQRHADADPRVRVIRQKNLGVAAARNAGLAVTIGRYVAPIDADDLWAPRKIERQLDAVRQTGRGKVGLVYTWFSVVDASGRVLLNEDRADAEGYVLPDLLKQNLVGNTGLVLREAIEVAGRYDTGLRGRGCEGCEDYRLYLKIAELYEFALVREFLTAYREVRGSMSGNVLKMIRSRNVCIDEFSVKYPEYHAAIRRGRTRFVRFMIARSVRDKKLLVALRMLANMFFDDPWGACLSSVELVRERAVRRQKKFTTESVELPKKIFEVGVL